MPSPSIKDLFVAALDLPDASARAEFLDRECASDPALRQRLEALLRAHDDPASVVNRPLVAPAEATGVKRRVAVKLIKAGMDSRAVFARFEAERQALALMDHPNIAKVFDAGATPDGRPFFVMELVKGVPITKYCDDKKLTPRERLELFVPVCQAIQHAHQKGVIHRDIKPSNVLIALYDDKPVPKVIDFGVAKAAGQPLTDRTLATGFGAVVGTPEYMSPEQASFNNLDIDTRSDVYALGVLLYELLAGAPPFSRQEMEKVGLLEIFRVIREQEPPRPSTKLSTADALPTLSANRGTEPKRLTALVRGELDWIVMKALEKDRNRRYESANGFAADVQRYLAGEAVQAVPPSAAYRMRKFVRRHKGRVAAASLILATMATGTAVATWQAIRAMRAEQQTMQERDRAVESEREAKLLQIKSQAEEQKALRSAAEANAMITFFKELTLEARRTTKDKEDGKERAKTIDEALAIIDSEKFRALFADHPLAEAEILYWVASDAFPGGGGFFIYDPSGKKTFGRGTFHFGSMVWPPESFGSALGEPENRPAGDDTGTVITFDTDANRRHLERALKLRTVHLGPNDPKTLATTYLLARTYLYQHEETAKALHLLSDLVTRSDATFGPDHVETLKYQDLFAIAYEFADRPEEVIRVRKEVYTRTATKYGRDSDESLGCSDRLAGAYEAAGRLEEALRQREESLRGRRRLANGSVDISVGEALRDVARLNELLQDYPRAEIFWREALLAVKEKESVLAELQESLGLCLLRNKKFAEAEAAFHQCLAFRVKTSPQDWQTYHTKFWLGVSLLEQRKYADAEPLLVQGYDCMWKVDNERDLSEYQKRVVQLYTAWGKPDQAKKWAAERAGYPFVAPPPRKVKP